MLSQKKYNRYYVKKRRKREASARCAEELDGSRDWQMDGGSTTINGKCPAWLDVK